jgi:hypothetical protein
MHEIILSTINGNVMAETVGGNENEIRNLFGTTILPTPYTDKFEPNAVKATIQALNPGAWVRWVGEKA